MSLLRFKGRMKLYRLKANENAVLIKGGAFIVSRYRRVFQ
jgi:hypothetical protein